MEVIKFVNSGVAVYSFFIISGFYIAMVLDKKYVGPGSASVFYANRYLRLWPTYAISLLIILFAVLQTIPWELSLVPLSRSQPSSKDLFSFQIFPLLA